MSSVGHVYVFIAIMLMLYDILMNSPVTPTCVNTDYMQIILPTLLFNKHSSTHIINVYNPASYKH